MLYANARSVAERGGEEDEEDEEDEATREGNDAVLEELEMGEKVG